MARSWEPLVERARRHARVAITYHKDRAGAERTAQLVTEAGGEPLVAPFALEDIATAARLIESVRAAWGALHTLVNNADGFPGSSAYMTGKAALHGLHRTLAKELGPAGVLANVVMSGAVESETRVRPPWLIEQMKRSAVTGRLTEADEVARTVVFLGSPANGHVTGEALRCDGFYVSGPRRESGGTQPG